MSPTDIAYLRLQNLGITEPNFTSAHDVVTHLGAMQAQDYPGAIWSLGLRLPGSTHTTIEEEISKGTIVRTWPMRGTLHFVPAEDARWMLQLMTPRIMRMAARREKELELTDEVYAKAFVIFRKILADGTPVLRSDLVSALEDAGIATQNQRGYHILWRASQEALLCLGPVQGKKPTYVLFDAWVKQSRVLSGDEAIAEMARRYFVSHGPATEKDFAGWTGLSLTEARKGIAALGSALIHEKVADTTYILPQSQPAPHKEPSVALLPGFDEYMLGYKDRSVALHIDHAPKIVPGNNGMFLATVVIDGRVAGLWRRTTRSKTVTIAISLFDGFAIDALHEPLLQAAAHRYGAFIGLETTVQTV